MPARSRLKLKMIAELAPLRPQKTKGSPLGLPWHLVPFRETDTPRGRPRVLPVDLWGPLISAVFDLDGPYIGDWKSDWKAVTYLKGHR